MGRQRASAWLSRSSQSLIACGKQTGFAFEADIPRLDGLLAFDEGQPHVGLARLKRAFALQPDDLFTAGDFAQAYVLHERIEDAIGVIEHGLRHHPGDERLLRIYDDTRRATE